MVGDSAGKVTRVWVGYEEEDGASFTGAATGGG